MDFLIREKADLFNSIYSYEVKLEEEQSKQLVHEDDVQNCSKCHTGFGWTVRKVNRSINKYHHGCLFIVYISIVVDIVKRSSVILVPIIGILVQHRSMLLSSV